MLTLHELVTHISNDKDEIAMRINDVAEELTNIETSEAKSRLNELAEDVRKLLVLAQ